MGLLELLLGAQLVGVPALLLAAVLGTGVQAGVAPGRCRRVDGEAAGSLEACMEGFHCD